MKLKTKTGGSTIIGTKLLLLMLATVIITKALIPISKTSNNIIKKIQINTIEADERFDIVTK